MTFTRSVIISTERQIHPQYLYERTQPAFTYSKLTIETLEKGVKYVQRTIKIPNDAWHRSGIFIVNFELL